MKDSALSVAHDPRAPADERQDAMTQLQKGAMGQVSAELINLERLAPLLTFIQDGYEDQAMTKALRKNNVIQLPSAAARDRKPGMQSVYLDDVQIGVMGDYYERQGVFSFDAMRQMVESTPILNAVIMTRIRQVQRFCRPQADGKGPGFRVSMRDKKAELGEDQTKSLQLLEKFFSHGGFEFKPRMRQRLKRDDMSTFMAKLVRDSLTMDAAPIETEFKRDRSLGIDGIYAVDGATIRLCTEQGYRGDDEIFAIQLVQGNIRSAYTYDDLVYVPRNPRTDVLSGGYGMGETELLIRVVTGFLNAFTYNVKFFDSNAMPRGVLNLFGAYSDDDIKAFKRYWNGMVKGINNAHALPVMVSKDQESAAKFESFGEPASELMFGKWMTFLASIICAIYGMAPDEINFESFTNGTSSLSGSDTEEKIASSKDKGLRPLLSYFQNLFTDYIVADFNEDAEFVWTGLDEEDEATVWDRKKQTMTVNEVRAEDGRKPIKETWGDAPLNPALVAAWQQEAMPQEQDFGMPGQSDPSAMGGQDFGDGGEEDFGQPGGQGAGGDDDQDLEEGGAGPSDDEKASLQKSFGLPVLRIEP
jgi:hypothetical protein